MPDLDEDELTEIYDADIPRVDLVGKAANGTSFLIAKGRALLDPGAVRALVGAEAYHETHVPEPEPAAPPAEVVTVTGTPAGIAELIHKAAMRAASINDLPDSDFAYIEPGGKKDEEGKTTPRSLRHFPIHDEAHARDALGRAPQSPFGDKAMPKIRAAAKRFGIDVSKETAMPDETADVVKADAPVEVGDIVDAPTGSQAETVPGSSDWETLDAETAQRAIAVLGRAKAAVDWLRDREAQECATDAEDGGNVADLDAACCALDAVIGTLGAFAAGEQIEAELGEEMDGVAKAVAALTDDPAPLVTLEGFAPIAKAGRVLSSANEQAIRQAGELLQRVLASLPAPVSDDGGQPVAKADEEAPVPEPTPATEPDVAAIDAAEDATPDPVEKTEAPEVDDVEKAKGDPLLAVFDENGKLVGMVDPKNLTPIAKPDGGSDEPEATTDAGAPADANDGPAAPEAAPVEPAPVEPAEATADDVAKSTETDPVELMKGILATQLQAVLGPIEQRLAAVESQPMPGGPMLNGYAPGAPQIAMRGQGDDTSAADVLRKAADDETDPVVKAALQQRAAEAAMAAVLSGRG
jgi:hypothetical protein